MLLVTPYFASRPTLRSILLVKAGAAFKSVRAPEMAYGFTSRFNPGGGVSLTITDPGVTNAAPAPYYRWYRDGNLLFQSSSPILVLTQLALTNSGTYSVVTSNSLGLVTNVVERVLVHQADAIPPGAAAFQNGLFQMKVNGTEGDLIALQGTTNFTDWTTLFSGNLAGYEQYFSDTNTPANPRRFYRLLSGAQTNLVITPTLNR